MNDLTPTKKSLWVAQENGQVVTRVSKDIPKKRKLLGNRTQLECILLVLLLLLFVAVVTLAVVLASKREFTPSFLLENSQHSNIYRIKSHALNGEEIELCISPDCVKGASRMMESMNPKADPCEDFYEFACGSWNQKNIIPEDRPMYNTFTKLNDELQVQLKDLLDQKVLEGDIDATYKAKRLFMSCSNTTLINERDLDPLKEFLVEFGGWPVLNDTWSPEGFNLIELLVRLRMYNNKILIENWVGPDNKNSLVNIIQLDQADLGMPSREYYLRSRDDKSLKLYEKFAVRIAIALGADEAKAKKEIGEIVDFEIQFANITKPESKRRDSEVMYNKMTVKSLQEKIPKFQWLTFLQRMFDEVNITINTTTPIVVYSPEFFMDLMELVERVDAKIINNYLIWRIVMNRVANLPEKYKNLRNEYYKAIYGSERNVVRWRECTSYVNENLGYAVGRLFVEAHFDEDAKSSALEMIHQIRNSFNELLLEATWMDDSTRSVAKEKATAMVEKIGYPEYILNNTAINEVYTGVEFHSERYFENVLGLLKFISQSNLKLLREPVDKTKWSTAPTIVNAFYSSQKNQIMFPAAILQPPFYSKGYPKSLNYGGIGMVIGHEITHGFDDKGRQFDRHGNLKQWWDDEVIARFKEQAQCIVDQYSNFTVEDISMNLNGIQTQGENIADNGGLKQSFRAYRAWIDRLGKEEPRLPGISQFNGNQLFFINFAQIWCGSMRPESAVNRIRTGYHSPGRFRVIGTLQNMDQFSNSFSCGKESYMNQQKKCSVW